MTLIAISGTPGVGKTSVISELRSRGKRVLDVNEYIRENGLLGEKDDERDTFSVDIDSLNSSLMNMEYDGELFLDSHMSHCIDCDMIFIFRCHPSVLAERLRGRGYSESKIAENVQAEILDVILCEASEMEVPVYEIDCTHGDVKDFADEIERVLAGNTDKYLPGNVDWTEELERWF